MHTVKRMQHGGRLATLAAPTTTPASAIGRLWPTTPVRVSDGTTAAVSAARAATPAAVGTGSSRHVSTRVSAIDTTSAAAAVIHGATPQLGPITKPTSKPATTR